MILLKHKHSKELFESKLEEERTWRSKMIEAGLRIEDMTEEAFYRWTRTGIETAFTLPADTLKEFMDCFRSNQMLARTFTNSTIGLHMPLASVEPGEFYSCGIRTTADDWQCVVTDALYADTMMLRHISSLGIDDILKEVDVPADEVPHLQTRVLMMRIQQALKTTRAEHEAVAVYVDNVLYHVKDAEKARRVSVPSLTNDTFEELFYDTE